MRFIKMLGLAVTAAIASMAFLGASTASADVLCLAGVVAENCQGVGHTNLEIKAEGTSELKTSAGNVSCHTLVTGKLTGSGGDHKGLTGTITNLNWEKCSGICADANAENLPYSASASGLNQHMVVTSSGKGNPAGLLTGCTFFNVACLYEANSVLLNVTGGNPMTLSASNVGLTRSTAGGHSSLCSATGTWNGTFKVTSPAGLLHLASLA